MDSSFCLLPRVRCLNMNTTHTHTNRKCQCCWLSSCLDFHWREKMRVWPCNANKMSRRQSEVQPHKYKRGDRSRTSPLTTFTLSWCDDQMATQPLEPISSQGAHVWPCLHRSFFFFCQSHQASSSHVRLHQKKRLFFLAQCWRVGTKAHERAAERARAADIVVHLIRLCHRLRHPVSPTVVGKRERKWNAAPQVFPTVKQSSSRESSLGLKRWKRRW